MLGFSIAAVPTILLLWLLIYLLDFTGWFKRYIELKIGGYFVYGVVGVDLVFLDHKPYFSDAHTVASKATVYNSCIVICRRSGDITRFPNK